MSNLLAAEQLNQIDAYWRATNYLSVGQIYLFDNPLLKEPLRKEHIKPRLLGHWGTTPGLNFIYVHLNRVIKKYDLSMLYIAGPGHGGPGWPAENVFTYVLWLPGAFGELFVGGGSFGGEGGSEVSIEPLLHGFDEDGGEPLADVGWGPVS